MQRDPREVIIRPVITEHSYDVMDNTVVKVNTLNVKPKPKRVRYQKKGYTRTWKKAMVTLAEGDTIEIFSA